MGLMPNGLATFAADLSGPLLSLSSRLAGFPGVEQRGFQLAISRRPCLSRSNARCRFPSFPFFFGGKLCFERRLLRRAVCCFLGCLLGRFVSLPRLLGGPALCDADLSRGYHRSSGRLALGKSRILQRLTMPLQQCLFCSSSGLLSFG
jgi:hypothetical protein